LKRTTLLLAIAGLLTLGVAGTAQAHFLTHKEARNATFQVARQDCNRINTCDRFGAGPCERLTAHRVRCRETLQGQNARGPYEVRVAVTISIRPGSDQRYFRKGNSNCFGPGC
jgi:hypothetical protein